MEGQKAAWVAKHRDELGGQAANRKPILGEYAAVVDL